VIRTRVGYAGGTTVNPTYHALGDHAETIQIDYDPTQISYEELLEVFWTSHSPTTRPWSRQYASLIFYHNEEQQRLAVESKNRKGAETGDTVFTEIMPFSDFYLAEDYHQKYRLRQLPELMAEFEAIYPDSTDFVNSMAAAKVNGYAGSHGTLAALQAEIDGLGLSPAAQQRLLDLVSSWER
jgi:peptide-methionine (S)-S-oxide reductase